MTKCLVANFKEAGYDIPTLLINDSQYGRSGEPPSQIFCNILHYYTRVEI